MLHNKLALSDFTINILFFLLVIIGVALSPLISVRLQPTTEPNSLRIQYSWGQVPGRILEQQVTSKLEGVFSSIRGVQNIQSESSNGSGVIILELDNYSNLTQIRHEVSALIRQLFPKLPVGLTYPSVVLNQPASKNENQSILTYAVYGDKSLSTIRTYIEKNIKPKLSKVDGVYDISVSGLSSYCWNLKYDPDILMKQGVKIEEVSEGITNYFKVYELGKGFELNSSDKRIVNYRFLTLKFSASNSVVWSKIPIKKYGNRIVYLTDVASVEYVEQDQSSFYRINGLNTIKFDVIASKNANYLNVANKVKECISSFQLHSSQEYSMLKLSDNMEVLETEMVKVMWRTVITIVILFLFVLLLIRQIRYLLLIVVSLISNLFISVIFFYIFGLEINYYSLAGITISMGIVIDNSILMINHIHHMGNKKVFIGVFGTTLTIIGTVSIIFLLDKKITSNLLDFAMIVIVNLVVSLFIVLFFIPSLMNKMPLSATKSLKSVNRKKQVVFFNHLYRRFIQFTIKRKASFLVLATITFGLPFFLLPPLLEDNALFSKVYNRTIGTKFYDKSMRPYIDKYLGGTMGLFINNSIKINKVSDKNGVTKITVVISMPNGASLKQMNDVVLSIERFLGNFEEIEMYHSQVSSGQDATMEIRIKKAFIYNSFPEMLQNKLASNASGNGLADFTILGVGKGFSNRLNEENLNYSLVLLGYNYDNLMRLAQRTKSLLLENNRVEKVYIDSQSITENEQTLNNDFLLKINNKELLLANNFSISKLNQAISAKSGEREISMKLFVNQEFTPVILSSISNPSNIWNSMNDPTYTGSSNYIRLKDISALSRENFSENIIRYNKQYRLVVSYNFIGDFTLGDMVANTVIKEVNNISPVGYTINYSNENYRGDEGFKLLWTLLLAVSIIFVICSVLFNSLKKAIGVIVLIPMSFIGAFIANFLVECNFDDGVYISFVILCGMVVNSSIFIINDFIILRVNRPNTNSIRLFVRAFNNKILPVTLSAVSMIIGLIPFVLYSRGDVFWYPLAISTIGGVISSIFSTILFLPMLIMNKMDLNQSKL